MAAKAGKGGSITFTGITVLIRSWTLTSGVDLPEITAFSDAGVEKSIAGVARWSAVCVGNADVTNTADPGDSATLTLAIDGSDNWDGEALLNSYEVGVAFDGVAGITYNFKGNGTLTPPS
jgi:hypothetical protein